MHTIPTACPDDASSFISRIDGRSLSAALATVFLLLGSVVPASADPTRVMDINTLHEPSDYFGGQSRSPAVLGSQLIFRGYDTDHGYELWATDGTVAGTRLLLDIEPGPAYSNPTELTVGGSRVFFVATTLRHGRELWETDGTTAGTRRIAETTFGMDGIEVRSLVWTGSLLWFAANSPSRGWEPALMEPGNGVRFFDLVPGENGSNPENLTLVPGSQAVFFTATTQGNGTELFRSNGSEGSTVLALDLVPGSDSSSPKALTFVSSNELLFSADTEGDGRELVWFNTSTSEKAVIDIEPEAGDSDPLWLVNNGGVLFYTAKTTSHGRELWAYSPVAMSNTRLSDINPGDADGIRFVSAPAPFGDGVCFEGEESSTGREPWCYDSTSGTYPLGNLTPGATGSDPRDFFVHQGLLYFGADSSLGNELYRSDGTPGGTDLFVDFNLGSTNDSYPSPIASLGSTLITHMYHFESAGVISTLAAVNGPSLWTWLGASVTDASSNPTALRPAPNGGLRFTAFRPDVGKEPWLVDGAQAQLIEDAVPGTEGLDVRDFVVHRERTVMIPSKGGFREPHVWDGSTLTPIDLLAGADSQPEHLVPVGDVVLTRGKISARDTVLWAIDPVAETAEQLTAEPVGSLIVGAGDTVFFFVGQDLYTTDGTLSGTQLVETVGSPNGHAAVLREAGAGVPPLIVLLVFEPVNYEHLLLWVSDGTPGGTGQLPTGFGIEPGTRVDMIAGSGHALISGAPPGSDYSELFLTDGTVLGTQQITDRAGDGGFTPSVAVTLLGETNGTWFYSDTRDASGQELWVTDGVTASMLELNTGPLGSVSQRPTGKNATILGERLVFSGFQPDTGYEIWASDGTAEGTVPLGEILPGPAGQEVRPVTSGHRVFFAAVGPDGDGKELWVWDPVVFADGFESGDLHAWSSH